MLTVTSCRSECCVPSGLDFEPAGDSVVRYFVSNYLYLLINLWPDPTAVCVDLAKLECAKPKPQNQLLLFAECELKSCAHECNYVVIGFLFSL